MNPYAVKRILRALCLIGASHLLACPSPGKKVVSVFAAASLGPTLEALEPLFEKRVPGADLRVELSASRIACAKVSDQGRSADIIFSADYSLVEELLRPKHTSFNFLFASNPLVLAYRSESPVAMALSQGEPWQSVLMKPKVVVGIANPAFAPVGYRALLALKLNDQVAPPPLRLGQQITDRITPKEQRPDVAKLIAPVETGEFDAAFVYRSTALQHGLKYVALDPRVDFSRIENKALYAQASIQLPAASNKPARRVTGSPSVYSLTILTQAPQPELAKQFVALLLSAEGQSLSRQAHLPLNPRDAWDVKGTLEPNFPFRPNLKDKK